MLFVRSFLAEGGRHFQHVLDGLELSHKAVQAIIAEIFEPKPKIHLVTKFINLSYCVKTNPKTIITKH